MAPSTTPAKLQGLLHSTIGPLILMATTPPLAFMIAIAFAHYKGSLVALGMDLVASPETVLDKWPAMTWEGLEVILWFAAVELVLLFVVPPFGYDLGPVSPMGARARYRKNGPQTYIVSQLLWTAVLFQLVPGVSVSPTVVVDNYGSIMAWCNVIALVLCLFLYLKGLTFPSGPDAGPTGWGFIADFYWGTELYPEIMTVSVKQFVASRLSMRAWSLVPNILLAAAYSRGEVTNALVVSSVLLHLYMFKFFVLWTEGPAGYGSTMDMAVDRASYYLIWGVCVFVTSLYWSPQMYIYAAKPEISTPLAATILVVGILCIWINYEADEQRGLLRRTQGQCKIWGRDPKVIRAKYTTADGKTRQSLLLVSGWWGVARHFHYVPELGVALCYALPVGLTDITPYLYWMFLVVLLLHRALRDEEKMVKKYGKYFEEYMREVPYRVIPYVY